jgi:hypothetical protein
MERSGKGRESFFSEIDSRPLCSHLEAAMRRLAQRAGLNGKIGTEPILLVRELYSSGYLSPEDFQRVEQTRMLRTEIVHGLAPPAIEAGEVQFLAGLARKLLAGPTNPQQAAG